MLERQVHELTKYHNILRTQRKWLYRLHTWQLVASACNKLDGNITLVTRLSLQTSKFVLTNQQVCHKIFVVNKIFAVNNNHTVLNREDSGSSGVQSMDNSASSLDTSIPEKDEPFYPPPPPPPPLPILEEEIPAAFPPPPPPPLPDVSGSFDQ